MKTLQILTIASLLLGLSQVASAAHDGMDHEPMHRHMWQDADTNKDGSISREEFMSAHQARAEKMFAKMDTNKDGKIDESERKTMQNRCDHHSGDSPKAAK